VQVFVKTLDGSTIAINVRRSDSVIDLKVAVAGRTGVPATSQVLSFAGKPIDGVRSLEEFGIVSVAPQTHFLHF
jgi:small subunit ribosomal protein S27Ae